MQCTACEQDHVLIPLVLNRMPVLADWEIGVVGSQEPVMEPECRAVIVILIPIWHGMPFPTYFAPNLIGQ